MPTPTTSHQRARPAPYRDPSQLLRRADLDAETKRSVLCEWLQDERALLVADEDGMEGGRASRLDEVVRAWNQVPSPAEPRRLA